MTPLNTTPKKTSSTPTITNIPATAAAAETKRKEMLICLQDIIIKQRKSINLHQGKNNIKGKM